VADEGEAQCLSSGSWLRESSYQDDPSSTPRVGPTDVRKANFQPFTDGGFVSQWLARKPGGDRPLCRTLKLSYWSWCWCNGVMAVRLDGLVGALRCTLLDLFRFSRVMVKSLDLISGF